MEVESWQGCTAHVTATEEVGIIDHFSGQYGLHFGWARVQ